MHITENSILQPAEFRRSPNVDQRPTGVVPDLVVIHCISLPAGSYASSYVDQLLMNTLDPAAHPSFKDLAGLKVSTHLFIDRQGCITQYVPFNQRAWHCGESQFGGRHSCNNFAIGIELEGTDTTPFEEIQYAKLIQATVALMTQYRGITLTRLVGHQEIAPQRKSDPGKEFAWQSYLSSVAQLIYPRV